jgi:hypothetical protein
MQNETCADEDIVGRTLAEDDVDTVAEGDGIDITISAVVASPI